MTTAAAVLADTLKTVLVGKAVSVAEALGEVTLVIKAADLVEHRPALEQEGAEQPVRLHGLRGTLVEKVVAALVLERLPTAQRRSVKIAGDSPASRKVVRRSVEAA